MMSDVEIEVIVLSLKVATLSTVISLPFAVAIGWLLARKEFVGKTFLDGILHLPLVLPPVITGYLLLLVFGTRGFVGQFLFETFGIRLAFAFPATVMASIIVSFPLVIRSVRLAIEMVDPGLEQAAQTLGANKFISFFTVTFPLALPGVIGGAVICFARSLGEFGATITFAGNIAGETQTLPLAVYSYMQVPGKESNAMWLVLITVIISFAALASSAWLVKKSKKRLGGRAK